ncbi:DEAD/DEAH box helicase [Alicyclobacillus fastidiosus]|uniref:DEAD/DEAH box helicase n=1 Tax=Alicyclobacillus fastidiosus TaxID=392011 RepID=A0ABY6ZEL8_9BACL|nr:DEAD/DEAH box helicase [Alicyclobacillus fastidiosus]WAH40998.1 DEAD/DEAH box helicase [Alicyclobacillus fastidiosus]GMA62513.1 DEAD-box ATP-dependent RNA helicase CshA [Alicyclobacillus fastidiosus]
MSLFSELNLSEEVLRSLGNMGFESATDIQSQAIPVAMSGTDVIGQAQTGTGKTVAFSIPVVEKVDTHSDALQALILTPTRELCIQVAEEIIKVGGVKGVRVLAVYGGQDIGRQIRALRNRPHVIVATPGRLMDHMNRRTARLDSIRVAVLDEADEMLDMGFVEDIETILGACPSERQTMLFSATMKPGVRELAKKFMRDFVLVSAKATEVTVPSIEQVYYEVSEAQKLNVLTRLLDIQSPELAIVFGRTKRRVDELTSALQTRGYVADGLHGDLSQKQRDNVMSKFRDGGLDVLVATDVAARGLDVSGVTHVYNFDIPQDIDSYVHRIGRTGRAGKSGIASTFVTPREIDHLHQIERSTKRKITRKPLPTYVEAKESKQRIAMDQLLEASQSGDLGGFRHMAEELLENENSIVIVSAAIKLLTKGTKEVPITLTAERPVRIRGQHKDRGRDHHRGRDGARHGSSRYGKGGSAAGGHYRGNRGRG